MKFRNMAVMSFLSLGAISGCGDKNQNKPKPKTAGISFNPTPMSELFKFKDYNESKMECDNPDFNNIRKCKVTALDQNKAEVFSFDLSFNKLKDSSYFQVKNIKLPIEKIKKLIIESFNIKNKNEINFVNNEVNKFDQKFLSNIEIGQNNNFEPTLSFRDDESAKKYIIELLNNIKTLFNNDVEAHNEIDNIIQKISAMKKIDIANIMNALTADEKYEFQSFINNFKNNQLRIYENFNQLSISYYDNYLFTNCSLSISGAPSGNGKTLFMLNNDKATFTTQYGTACH